MVNRLFSIFIIKSAVYLYEKKQLYDIIKTNDNPNGVFCTSTFRDDSRLIVGTIHENSGTSIQIKDYTLHKDYIIEHIFGCSTQNLDHQIGDMKIDEAAEKVFIANGSGIFIKVYRLYDLKQD